MESKRARSTKPTTHSVMDSKNIGQFIMGEKLGEGTFGKVKKGTHILTGEKVAIKILEKSRILEKADKIRVEREIKILKMLKHKHIVELYSVIQTSTTIFLIMELSSGKELFDYIVKKKRLDESEASAFFTQIISSCQYLHSLEICHRDLKPENLLLNGSDGLKLVDFGLSNLMPNNQLLGTACGSPCYAAPEMLEGNKYEGNGVDIWSCGIILYAMACGYLPFEDKNNDALYKKIKEGKFAIPSFVSEPCKDLIKRILVTNPLKRIKIPEIFNHPWFKMTNPGPADGLHISRFVIPVDEDIIKKMEKYGFSKEESRANILSNKHNQYTTTYYLLLKVKIRNGGSSVSDLKSKLFYDYIKDRRNLLSNYSDDLSIVIRERNCTNPKLPVLSEEPKAEVVEEETKFLPNSVSKKSHKKNIESSNSKKQSSSDITPKNTSEAQETTVKEKQSGKKPNRIFVGMIKKIIGSDKDKDKEKERKEVKEKDKESKEEKEDRKTETKESSNTGKLVEFSSPKEKEREEVHTPHSKKNQKTNTRSVTLHLSGKDTTKASSKGQLSSNNDDLGSKSSNPKQPFKKSSKMIIDDTKDKESLSGRLDTEGSIEEKNNKDTHTSDNIVKNLAILKNNSGAKLSHGPVTESFKPMMNQKIPVVNRARDSNKKTTYSSNRNADLLFSQKVKQKRGSLNVEDKRNTTDNIESVHAQIFSNFDTNPTENSDVEFSPDNRARSTSTKQKDIKSKNMKFSVIPKEPILEYLETECNNIEKKETLKPKERVSQFSTVPRKNKFSAIGSQRDTRLSSKISTPKKYSKLNVTTRYDQRDKYTMSVQKNAKKDLSYNFNGDYLYTDLNNKTIKERKINYCLQPNTKRELTVAKPSKTFNRLIHLTTYECKNKQLGEFGAFKNFKKDEKAPYEFQTSFSKKTAKDPFKSVVSKTYVESSDPKHRLRQLENNFRPRDLNCIFSEDKDYFLHLIKTSLQKLLISSVFRENVDVFKCNKSKVAFEIEVYIFEDTKQIDPQNSAEELLKKLIGMNFKLLNGSKFEYRKVTSNILKKLSELRTNVF